MPSARYPRRDHGTTNERRRRALNQPISYESRADGGTETADTVVGRERRHVQSNVRRYNARASEQARLRAGYPSRVQLAGYKAEIEQELQDRADLAEARREIEQILADRAAHKQAHAGVIQRGYRKFRDRRDLRDILEARREVKQMLADRADRREHLGDIRRAGQSYGARSLEHRARSEARRRAIGQLARDAAKGLPNVLNDLNPTMQTVPDEQVDGATTATPLDATDPLAPEVSVQSAIKQQPEPEPEPEPGFMGGFEEVDTDSDGDAFYSSGDADNSTSDSGSDTESESEDDIVPPTSTPTSDPLGNASNLHGEAGAQPPVPPTAAAAHEAENVADQTAAAARVLGAIEQRMRNATPAQIAALVKQVESDPAIRALINRGVIKYSDLLTPDGNIDTERLKRLTREVAVQGVRTKQEATQAYKMYARQQTVSHMRPLPNGLRVHTGPKWLAPQQRTNSLYG